MRRKSEGKSIEDNLPQRDHSKYKNPEEYIPKKTKQYKLTQYQSTDVQRDIYKKIGEKYRSHLIEEYKKYSADKIEKDKKILELEQQNAKLSSETPKT